MLDMDNFKAVNDNYGHIAGDETLKIFAGTLKKFAGEGMFFVGLAVTSL